MAILATVRAQLRSIQNNEKARTLQRFFKTGPGQYAAGDRFIGVTVPVLRALAARFPQASLSVIEALLSSAIHEERFLALLFLIARYKKSGVVQRKSVFTFYLRQSKRINNWDLVDLSAPTIMGAYLYDKKRDLLYRFAQSSSLWRRRIAIVSTLYFIKRGDCGDAVRISKILLGDSHQLIHKAVGWMLREVGKRKAARLERFLQSNYHRIPRTTLRYAIERFPEEKRKEYLRGVWEKAPA